MPRIKRTVVVQLARWVPVAITLKTFSSLLFLGIGISVHVNYLFDADHGVRAAVCAMTAAGVILAEAIPLGNIRNQPLAVYVSRFCGAILAFLTALNWVLAETDGQWFPFLGLVLAVFGWIILLLLFGLLSASSIRPRQSEEHRGFTGEVCETLGTYLPMCSIHRQDSIILVPGDLFPSCNDHDVEWVAILA